MQPSKSMAPGCPKRFLSLFPAGFSPRVATVEDLADELDILTFSGATGTKYRAEDVKAALGYF
jgi:hypothetical protein